MHLVFVCTGNICRSPTCERLARAYADAVVPDPAEVTIDSYGTRAVVGSAMEPTAELVLAGLGGDGRDFRARQLDDRLMARADLIITMTRDHRASVLNLVPRALARTFTLREAYRLSAEVDPTTLTGPDLAVRARLFGAELTRRRRTHAPTERRDDDITDPIGMDAAGFSRIGDELAGALIPVLDVLFDVSGERPAAP